MEIDNFNIRVYGFLWVEDKLLLMKEKYAGEMLVKLPGGGLEYGEGLKDCLKREFQEELNLEIEVGEHFYTQDFFMQSKFKANEQIIMCFYHVHTKDIQSLKVLDQDIEKIIWVSQSNLSEDMVSLPVDKVVINKLIKSLKKDH